MFRSLRWRIALPFIFLIVIALVSMGIYLANFAQRTYMDTLEINNFNEAQLIIESLSLSILTDYDFTNLDQKAKNWSDTLNKRVTIIAADGTVLGESHEDRNLMDNHSDRPEIQDALVYGKGSSIRFSHTLKKRMLYVAVPFYDESIVLGYVRLALPLDMIAENVNHIRGTLITVIIIAITLTILIAIWMSRRIIKPLHELTIFAGDVSKQISDSGHQYQNESEIDSLTNSINKMTLQLQTKINELDIQRGRMAAVLGEMTDGVVIFDSEGQIQLMNPAAERIFKVKQKAVVGQMLIHIIRNHKLEELWQKSKTSGETQFASIELSNPNLYLQAVVTPLGQALPGSTLLLLQDVTQIRQLETIRKDFISNISHELRTPLASLKALTETLQESALDDPPAAHRFLERMETEVDSLSLMVSELLELTRIESGRVPLNLSNIQPCILLEKAVDRLRLQAERSNLQIEIDCSPDLEPIYVDEKRLEQVLVNLLHNAIKFTPPGGMIIVSVKLLEDQIQFSVKDTGVGIPIEDIPRIFERFYKADRSRSSTGTGLGLAIARHLIEAHGGNIWVESIEGKGSTFFFSLPLYTPININNMSNDQQGE